MKFQLLSYDNLYNKSYNLRSVKFDFLLRLLDKDGAIGVFCFPELVSSLDSAFAPSELSALFEAVVPVDPDDPIVQMSLRQILHCVACALMSVESA